MENSSSIRILCTLIFIGFFVRLSTCQDPQGKVLVCYWATWSHYKPGKAQFRVENIPPDLCTHLVYTFVGLNDETWEVKVLDPWLDYGPGDCEGGAAVCSLDNMRKTVALRNSNPDLRVTLAVGGWGEGSEKYSVMAADPAKRKIFIDSYVKLMKDFDFDGVDIDWEYPSRRGGIPEDKANFVTLMKELREALDEEPSVRGRRLLTAAFGMAVQNLDISYDIPELAVYLDYFHLMLYDYKMYLGDADNPIDSPDYNPAAKLIGHHSPLFSKGWEDESNRTMTNSYSVEAFIERGAPPEKLVFGIGTYGKTYELYNRSMHNFYDEAKGPGEQSEFTIIAGTSSYYEICMEFSQDITNWEISLDIDYQVPYAFSNTKWIGYDNEISARTKVDYAMSKGLAGMMVWSLDFDDFANYCGGWTSFGVTASLKDRLQFHQSIISEGKA